ncbi:Sulfate-transporting ATPase protein [Dioscorea alata]|uniref:Sulfate-transporting ATPase protein n=1 Tax=Dioscorea alata TaxID=55571 RepID=A0ACB7UAV2_DIOAL|nr:Sulfate-transporting ATPase protein [Dioscorea alata]
MSEISKTSTMENVPIKRASLAVQMNALMRKNLTFQKRNLGTNIRLLVIPVLLCLLLFGLEKLVNHVMGGLKNTCECRHCQETNHNEENCSYVCSVELFEMASIDNFPCPISQPAKWPQLFSIPKSEFRATKRDNSRTLNNLELPDKSCRVSGNCPVSILITGFNRTLAQSLGKNLYGTMAFSEPVDALDPFTVLSEYIIGTSTDLAFTYYADPAFLDPVEPLFLVQQNCNPNMSFPLSIKVDGVSLFKEVECVEGLTLWRRDSSSINREIYSGFKQSNPNKDINEYFAAYDFLNTNGNIFNVTLWHKETSNDNKKSLSRILRTLNAASNSYLQFFRGANVKMVLDFAKEMPKSASPMKRLDISAAFGPPFFTWIIEMLLPVMLVSLVYEKQNNLRMIMKMHSLGDCPYWIITYAYFLLISSLYILVFILFGSFLGLKIFTLNDYSVQSVFYFIYINLQIALAFFSSIFFSEVKTAAVIGYVYVFASGLFSGMILNEFHDDNSNSSMIILIQILPFMSLYRGLSELGEYSLRAESIGVGRVGWRDIWVEKQGLLNVLLIMFGEWVVLLMIAFYFDQVLSIGSGVRKHPLWFMRCVNSERKRSSEIQQPYFSVEVEKSDVAQEEEKVEKLLHRPCDDNIIVCSKLKKVYPGRDGNPEKFAVNGLTLTVSRGECFGMLGPNGAGKTSFIKMMTGLTPPSSGTAFVRGLDIGQDMDKVYCSMGVCPQHDLLWETLTGREHLLFYGRLKNLHGSELEEAVKESLQSVNLSDKANTLSGKYSGGMKRRLSVAISLIGNPCAVYLDEPSTGLDPASRKYLWSALLNAKQNKAIILTTHSMEEAEALCDRVGIFVDGSLQCIGNPKEVTNS